MLLRRYSRSILIIEEIGYLPLGREQANLFFFDRSVALYLRQYHFADLGQYLLVRPVVFHSEQNVTATDVAPPFAQAP